MKAFLDKVENQFTITVQAIKEKTGTTKADVDPEYQSAVEQFEIVKSRVHKFIGDINDIITIIPDICKSGVHFSQSLISAEEKNNGSSSDLSQSFDVFFRNMQDLVDSELIKMSEPAVMEILRNLQIQFKELEELQKNRRTTQLLCDSLRDKLAKISNSGNPNEVAQVRLQFEAKQTELKKLTDDFKNQMKSVWEQRFNMLDVPFQQFVGIIFLFCQQSYGQLQELQKNVTKEELMHEYPVSDDM
ncbi:hypothetical protein M9Y10_011385 [Tritrichomonas musculus]|uniref:BAR domain-containing protein n=1 Tax=Tritrichomonas musculus TaxID=1915356 RepID=A0ABR2IJ86_9EUKA